VKEHLMDADEQRIQPRENLYSSGGIQAIRPFEPGQIMTAADLNELVEALKELDQRLGALENG
jgi:hypothetical protein